MRVARQFVVSGRVQGVGFRFFVQDAARVAGGSGWIRNRADGAVEAFVEGESKAVDRVEIAIRRGPGGARVSHVTVEAVAPVGRSIGFSIEG